MKKKLEKTLKQLEINIQNKTHSIELTQCECCSDFIAVITNKKSDESIYNNIESAQDYFEFMNLFEVVTGDDLLIVTASLNDYSEKKFNKLNDRFFECLDEEYK